MRSRPIAALLTCAVSLAAVPARRAGAYVPEKTPRRDAVAAAHRVLRTPAARRALAGVVVLRSGRMLFDLRADRAFAPASLLKLTTTTTALVRFGPAHRFATRVAIAPIAGGTTARLYLIGGGDPTLATAAYRAHRFLPKPTDLIKRPAFATGSPTIEELAGNVRAAGVKEVDGDLIADDTLFDARRVQRGWLLRYTQTDPDTGYLSALTINEGMGDLDGKTVAASPTLAAGLALKAALASVGVRVLGGVRAGRTPAGARVIAKVESPPLAQIVDFTNRYSINYDAETLLKNLGASFGGAGTTEAGVRVVRQTMSKLGVPARGLVMTDGSGLSVLDRITPRTLATLLDAILTRPGPVFDVERASIPVAGRPGTLEKRMRAAPTAGNLRGKTGQIQHVRCMAGWVTASDGEPIVYVIMFNDAPSPFALTGPLDLFGLLLARFPGS